MNLRALIAALTGRRKKALECTVDEAVDDLTAAFEALEREVAGNTGHPPCPRCQHLWLTWRIRVEGANGYALECAITPEQVHTGGTVRFPPLAQPIINGQVVLMPPNGQPWFPRRLLLVTEPVNCWPGGSITLCLPLDCLRLDFGNQRNQWRPIP